MGGTGVTTDARDGVRVVRVLGELDIANTQQLREACASHDGLPVVIDLSRCDFIDSSAIAGLVEAWRELADEPENRRLALVATRGPVRRILRISGLPSHMGLYRSVAAAAGALTASRADG